MQIRKEKISDYQLVFELIKKAFKDVELSDHQEQFLVERLRRSNDFIPNLSLVAELEGRIVGHIILSRISIKGNQLFPALALAPVSVLPDYQRKGIGSALINKAHIIAKQLGHKLIVLVGHEDYYPRFGYEQAHKHDITFPFPVPQHNGFVLGLTNGALDGVNGQVVYPSAFFGD